LSHPQPSYLYSQYSTIPSSPSSSCPTPKLSVSTLATREHLSRPLHPFVELKYLLVAWVCGKMIV
jgi:hypothetical protein